MVKGNEENKQLHIVRLGDCRHDLHYPLPQALELGINELLKAQPLHSKWVGLDETDMAFLRHTVSTCRICSNLHRNGRGLLPRLHALSAKANLFNRSDDFADGRSLAHIDRSKRRGTNRVILRE